MAEHSTTAKPTLVLLHGWGLNQGVWSEVQLQLAGDFQVLALDLPGFGLSRQFPPAYRLDEVLSQLAAQLPEQSYLCGWSLGGLLAIALAATYPDKVKQLALVAATPKFLATDDWPGMRAEVMQQFASALSQNLPQTIQRFLAIQALGSEHAKQDILKLRDSIAHFPEAQPQAVVQALTLLADTDLRQQFAALTQPVVGCYGRLDSLVPVAVLPLLQQLQPAAKLTVLAKASHAPFISHPGEFCQWLRSALQ
ncbi:pimeloyl-ACP methyl ester esterase BioH [Alishewanella jeotgali]|uniref:Pimeloyl-[acyl-carrier protein] methyl ester esterase n=1 Tax=Alishewanella jeotgali KCTC 22429 TaxID=1129374 RepID=H3ZF30_9ALTE|nr:pimeloyl-ACP methyl ester esterase BioH [Alishewanella jeotgali]EHR40848.1 carboxylesterase BioH [Alishewanella jeotgali KCTC 22429]